MFSWPWLGTKEDEEDGLLLIVEITGARHGCGSWCKSEPLQITDAGITHTEIKGVPLSLLA